MASSGLGVLACDASRHVMCVTCGVTPLRGRFDSCTDPSVAGMGQCNGTFIDPATNTTQGKAQGQGAGHRRRDVDQE